MPSAPSCGRQPTEGRPGERLHPGQVSELEAADGEAYALATGADSANSTSDELLTAPVGSQQWRQVPTPTPLGYGAQFALSGPNLYVLGGNGDLVLLYSTDQGAQFSQRVDPAPPVSGAR